MTAAAPAPVTEAYRRREPDRPATLADAVRAEWLKLASVRSTWITLAITVALGVGLGVLIAHLGADRYASDRIDRLTWDPTGVPFRALDIAQLAIIVLGALVVTSEYGTGSIRSSLTAVPRRGRFMAAKMLVFTAVGLVTGEVVAFAAFFLSQLVIGSAAPQASIGGHDVLRAVIGAGLFLAVIGLAAAGVGMIVRNTAAAISALVALLFVAPGVIAALPNWLSQPLGKYWPTEAGSQIFVVHRDAHTLAAWAGFGVLCAFTAAVLLVGRWVLGVRDA